MCLYSGLVTSQVLVRSRAEHGTKFVLSFVLMNRSVLVIHMKDAHGEKTAGAPSPGTKTSITSNTPLAVTGIVKNSPINIAKLGPPPPLVPIKASPLKLTLPAPASVKPSTLVQSPAAGVPKTVSKLPTAAQVFTDLF
jgi:hypothetical protein